MSETEPYASRAHDGAHDGAHDRYEGSITDHRRE